MTQKQQDITGLQSALSEAVTMLDLLRSDVCVLNQFAGLKQNLIDCFNRGGKVLVAGNGGFAAISQHIVAELVGKLRKKRNPLPALSLASDIAVLTCGANDFGFEKVFSRQIEALAKPEDIFLGLTTSGKSKNILEAISVAIERGLSSFVITGENPPLALLELCPSTIQLPFSQTESIQDITMILFHKLCRDIESSLFSDSENNVWQRILASAKTNRYKWLILDRDGVVNELTPNGYVTNIDDVILNRQFLAICKDLSDTFKGIFIVTNQACIGKGLATEAQVQAINNYILSEIEKHGGYITDVFVCPYADSESEYRKPNIGIANNLRQQYPDVDFSETLVIGDSYSDSLFATRLGASFIKINNA